MFRKCKIPKQANKKQRNKRDEARFMSFDGGIINHSILSFLA